MKFAPDSQHKYSKKAVSTSATSPSPTTCNTDHRYCSSLPTSRPTQRQVLKVSRLALINCRHYRYPILVSAWLQEWYWDVVLVIGQTDIWTPVVRWDGRGLECWEVYSVWVESLSESVVTEPILAIKHSELEFATDQFSSKRNRRNTRNASEISLA